jgi:hypothetical protein
MKLVYCFLISALLATDVCQAQLPIKIKAGAARSSLETSGGFTFENNAATWYGGIATTLKMGKRFFFQPEILYSTRGGDIESSYFNDKLVRRYGYISVPLLLGWHPFKKASLLLGAEPGYMVWERAKDYSEELTYQDVDRRFDIDIDLGLSYQVFPQWTVEARAVVGSVALYEETGRSRRSGDIYKTGNYIGRNLMFQLGLCYDLKTK